MIPATHGVPQHPDVPIDWPDVMDLDDWYREFWHRANREGWSIYETYRGLEIERNDEQAVFDDDSDAWEYVWTHRDHPECAEALRIVSKYSPIEFAWICSHVYGWPS